MKKRRRASAVVVANDKLLVVCLEDPHTKVTRYFVPGGKIEDCETAAGAAIRETREETGVQIIISNPVPVTITYPFTWNNIVYECTTSFFAATCEDPSIPEFIDDAPYNRGALWLEIAALEKFLGFDRPILKAVVAILKENFSDLNI